MLTSYLQMTIGNVKTTVYPGEKNNKLKISCTYDGNSYSAVFDDLTYDQRPKPKISSNECIDIALCVIRSNKFQYWHHKNPDIVVIRVWYELENFILLILKREEPNKNVVSVKGRYCCFSW